ncbi:unnamed protein product, partial [Nesidiocoris tenuis]
MVYHQCSQVAELQTKHCSFTLFVDKVQGSSSCYAFSNYATHTDYPPDNLRWVIMAAGAKRDHVPGLAPALLPARACISTLTLRT